MRVAAARYFVLVTQTSWKLAVKRNVSTVSTTRLRELCVSEVFRVSSPYNGATSLSKNVAEKRAAIYYVVVS